MTTQPAADVRLVPAPEAGVWRLDKQEAGLTYDRLLAEDSTSQAGNRWSTPRCGVLYCSSHQDACFAEDLVALKVHPDMRDDVEEAWQQAGQPAPGIVVRDWTAKRTLLRLAVPKPFLFLDVDDETTQRVLTKELSDRFDELGVDDPELTGLHMRGRNRRLTRAIVEWALEQQTPRGTPRIHGIAYRSNYAMRQCWAIFQYATPLTTLESSYVYPEAEPLQAVAQEYGLRVM
ncbi:RES family NAD+ phosphorylase [Streptomyces sp. NPDC040750]|uniref:RES family NAD+ phosphorylase n=1 Tax=Streptomyces sp. NPDC040750 TaxID=3154491 RepID=UPI0033DAB1B4